MKNVLITGGSRGIGKALVYEFSKKGYRVFLNYNSSQKEAEQISADTGAVIVKADNDTEQYNLPILTNASESMTDEEMSKNVEICDEKWVARYLHLRKMVI